MAIVRSLADGIRRHLPPGGALVRAVVEVGALEHLDPEVVQSAWTACSDGPPLAGGRLELHSIPVRIHCRACGLEYSPDRWEYLVCPVCGQARPEVLEGWGVTIRSLEADVPGEEEVAGPYGEGSYEER